MVVNLRQEKSRGKKCEREEGDEKNSVGTLYRMYEGEYRRISGYRRYKERREGQWKID
jgi:hypothetical protein